MIEKAFESVENLSKKLDNNINEIYVRKTQMLFTFEDETIISYNDLTTLANMDKILGCTDITSFNNMIFVGFRNLNQELMQNEEINENLRNLYDIIGVLYEHVCQCPALEFVVSNQYLKVFLDSPNIHVSNLYALNNIFHQDPFIELGSDRPYLLYIKESDLYE